MSNEHESHGHTVAAWTAVIIAIIGFTLGSIAVVLANQPLFWFSVALLPVALIAGKVLALMGFGATPKQ